MSNRPLRFIHAADFHLEQPPSGIAAVPDHLRESFLESPWLAAERVFEAVLSEEAEFLVLSGDLLHPLRTGPRGPLFLAEQFERLAQRAIPVYWAAGRVDPPELWPSVVPLSDNVHVFPAGRPEAINYLRNGVPAARLVGAGRLRGHKMRASEFEPDPAGLFTIAVVHGSATSESLRARDIDYWALGGNHTRTTLFTSPHTAHYPGTSQGRQPEHCGAHGCTLVQVDESRKLRTTLIPCDALRWQAEHVASEPSLTREGLETRLRDRVERLRESMPESDLLLSWTIAGSGSLATHLRRGRLALELLEMLRNQFGAMSPAAWSVAMEIEPAVTAPAEWLEQDTICGAFLREFRQEQLAPEKPIVLTDYLPPELADKEPSKRESEDPQTRQPGLWEELAEISDPATRESVLREAAMLGADLLSGEEALP